MASGRHSYFGSSPGMYGMFLRKEIHTNKLIKESVERISFSFTSKTLSSLSLIRDINKVGKVSYNNLFE